MFLQAQDQKLLDEISENSKRGLAELVGMRDNDPNFLAHNPDWEPTGGYIGIMPGPPPRGFKAERIAIGTRSRKSGGAEKHYVQRLVPNHDNSEWDRCKLAWEMRAKGDGLKKIMEATKLYKSKNGFVRFFGNPIYTGALHYGGRVYEKFVPVMISEDVFNAEQERRKERGEKLKGKHVGSELEPRRAGSRYLLSGMVFCGEEDEQIHPMIADTSTRKNGNRWNHYVCSNKKKGCPAKRISAEALHNAVIETLIDNVLTIDNLRPLTDEINARLGNRDQELEVRIEAVRASLSEIKTSIKTLVDSIEKMGFSKSLQGRLAEREQEELKLLTELDQLERAMATESQIKQVTEKQLEGWIEAIRAALLRGDIDLKRKAIKQFVEKVVITENKKGVLYYTLPLSHNTRIRMMTPAGTHSYPRYPRQQFPFEIARAYTSHSNPGNRLRNRSLLRDQTRELRKEGMSYTEIGRQLNISTASAWNLDKN